MRLDLLAVLVAAGLAACGDGDDTRGTSATGPSASAGIVVESTALKTEDGDFKSCVVGGTVRNDTATNRKVTLTFTAFNKNGKDISSCFLQVLNCGPATAENESGGDLVVPAGGRSRYRAFLVAFGDCGAVARLEITQLKSEPVA